MESLVGFEEGGNLAIPRCGFQPVVCRAQGLDVAWLGMADGIGSATAFEHGHQREDVVEVLARDFSDIAATAWFQFDQAFGGENLERFAQRGAGDAVLFGELLLVDPGARRQFVRKDPLSQSFGDFLVERGRCNSGHGGVKVGMARSVRCRLASIIMDKVLCTAGYVKLGPTA